LLGNRNKKLLESLDAAETGLRAVKDKHETEKETWITSLERRSNDLEYMRAEKVTNVSSKLMYRTNKLGAYLKIFGF